MSHLQNQPQILLVMLGGLDFHLFGALP